MEDKGVDLLFMQFLAQHFADEKEMMFAGPDTGANNAIYFCPVQELPQRYPRLKSILEIVRCTAGLYTSPNRSLVGVDKAWCIAMDFDYDRGEWSGVKRTAQDATLYEFCSWITPTAVVQTGHGWHLYWVLDKPISNFDYAYPASLIKANLKADSRSILPVQCLNFHSRNKDKPAVMVDGLTLASINKFIPTFPNDINYYRVQDIQEALGKSENKALSLLRKNMMAKFAPTGYDYNERRLRIRSDTDDILEHYDIVGELNAAGYRASLRAGGRIACQCPFHDDRNPSAFIDVNPSSSYYGMFFCTSTSCHKTATLRKVLEEIGAM